MRDHFKRLVEQLLLSGSLLISSQVVTAADKVVVLTSYPQEMISHFEEAFEQAYPDYTLEVIWKQSNDALVFIKNNRQEVDVYWTPSRNNFNELGQQGYFLKLDESITRAHPAINGLPLNDPSGYFVATEIAGLGMVVNQAEIKKLKLDMPTDWGDLANPSYQEKVAFPIPSKVGFATGLLDAMLQGKSWEEGWSIILGIAANATLIESGSTLITEEVANARQAVGFIMDFFAASAIAKGAHLTYVYPPHVSYSPAHIALLKDAPNMAGAKAFLSFTLSEQGQTLLFHRDIRKLPIEAKVYAYKPAGYFNPYAYADSQSKSIPRSLVQQSVLNALFDAAVSQHHAILVKIYHQYHQLKSMHPNDQRLAEVWALINSPILSEEAANTTAVLQAFERRKVEASAEKQVQAYVSTWSAQALARYTKGEQLLYAIPAN